MAIQVDITNTNFGVPFLSAYCRIGAANVARIFNAEEKHIVMIDVTGFASIPADDNVTPVEYRRYHCFISKIESEDGDTFLAKCYSWLMKQPNMSGAIAV